MRLVGAIKGMSQNRGQNKDWEPVINITNINIIELPQPNVNGICTIWPLFYGQFSPIVLKAHLMPPLHYVLKVLIKSPSSTKQNQTELIQQDCCARPWACLLTSSSCSNQYFFFFTSNHNAVRLKITWTFEVNANIMQRSVIKLCHHLQRKQKPLA